MFFSGLLGWAGHDRGEVVEGQRIEHELPVLGTPLLHCYGVTPLNHIQPQTTASVKKERRKQNNSRASFVFPGDVKEMERTALLGFGVTTGSQTPVFQLQRRNA